ncbi:hypothetical protein PR048_010702 [Dryococelus australis]|uniref:Uncharacterized protein n=1 Tax=Dryococelus australis TaxID=614101 RepID=A0ABQ9I3W8_9NEOP|nr:hypothetical protein PR048_010702 [Dryococelus australis]
MDNLAYSTPANHQAGFRKCGIVPVSVELLSPIPRAECNENEVQASFLDSLEKKRVEWTSSVGSQKGRKMKVTPGQSVTNERDNCKYIMPENTLKSKSSGDDNSNDMHEEQIVQDSSNETDLQCILHDEEKEVQFDQQAIAVARGQKSPRDPSLKTTKRNIGEYAVFCYEEDLLPGVLAYCNDRARISAMKRSCKSWKWPKDTDKLFYCWKDMTAYFNVKERFFFSS